MKTRIAFATAFLALTAGSAFAQSAVVVTDTQVPVVTEKNDAGGELAGAATGAVAGAVVGGPIGAAVGGAAGLVVGAIADPAEKELTYVRTNRVDPIAYEGDVVVGATLPETVMLQEIPDSQYRYVYVNEQPVFVDPTSRQIVYIQR